MHLNDFRRLVYYRDTLNIVYVSIHASCSFSLPIFVFFSQTKERSISRRDKKTCSHLCASNWWKLQFAPLSLNMNFGFINEKIQKKNVEDARGYFSLYFFSHILHGITSFLVPFMEAWKKPGKILCIRTVVHKIWKRNKKTKKQG